MSFGSRFRERRKELGITQPEIANLLDVSQSAITNWETDTNSPRAGVLYDVFNILRCDANYLFQDEMKELYDTEATPDEFNQIIKPYRALDNAGRQAVNYILEHETARVKQLHQVKEDSVQQDDRMKRIIPYYGKTAAAGSSVAFPDIMDGTIECDDTKITRAADFSIGVNGDSMEPTYFDGDVVLVCKTCDLDTGDIGIFQKDNAIFIKELGAEGLISHNPKYPPMIDASDVFCLGKVIGKL